MDQGVLVTGADGRIGRMLRRIWGADAALWQSRAGGNGCVGWDMLAHPWQGPSLKGAVILNLAGVTVGARLSDNAALAGAVTEAAQQGGAAHVFLLSTAAVYGPGKAGNALSESDQAVPANDYGRSKLEMEALAAGIPNVTVLRLGNVAGADALLGKAQAGKAVILDPVPGLPGGPERSYIGPVTLARVLARLCVLARSGWPLPAIVNVAATGPVAMADLLVAAGLEWRFGPPNPSVIPSVVLDTTRLETLVTLEPADPVKIVAEWREYDA